MRRQTPILLFLSLLSIVPVMAQTAPEQAPLPGSTLQGHLGEPAAAPGGANLTNRDSGVTVVIDPQHIAATIQQILVDQVMRGFMERNLDKLLRIPFSDPQNFTGAFLANMSFFFGDPNSPIPSISFFHEDIREIAMELFPGWQPFGEIETDFLQVPMEDARQWEIALYLTRREEAGRLLEILRQHAAQLSRERQGLLMQRVNLPGADGSVEHLQNIAATLHALADGDSSVRQLMLFQMNREIVRELREESREAQHAATAQLVLERWSPPGGRPPRMVAGFRVSD